MLASVFLKRNLLKEAPTQVFSCEIFEIFKNTNFEEYLGTTTSEWGILILNWLMNYKNP